MRGSYCLHDNPTAVSVLGLVRQPYSLTFRVSIRRFNDDQSADPVEKHIIAITYIFLVMYFMTNILVLSTAIPIWCEISSHRGKERYVNIVCV